MNQSSKNPPFLARWLFRRMTGYQENFSISGDVDEVFQSICREDGYANAYVWYWYQCLSSLGKYTVKNMLGQEIGIKGTIRPNGNTQLDLGHLPKAVYFISVRNGTAEKSLKIIIQ